jgi:hypothetical protein
MDNPETQAILDTRYRTKTNTAKQTQHRKLSEYLEDTKGVIRMDLCFISIILQSKPTDSCGAI